MVILVTTHYVVMIYSIPNRQLAGWYSVSDSRARGPWLDTWSGHILLLLSFLSHLL